MILEKAGNYKFGDVVTVTPNTNGIAICFITRTPPQSTLVVVEVALAERSLSI